VELKESQSGPKDVPWRGGIIAIGSVTTLTAARVM
jgi:hypothetical protein